MPLHSGPKIFLVICLMLGLGGGWMAACSSSSQNVVVDSIAPKMGFEDKVTAVTIQGKNFPNPIHKVSLLGANQKEIVLENVERVDNNTIRADVPAQSSPGLYDVKIWSNDTTGWILGGAFEIAPYALRIYMIDIGQGDATLIQSPSGKTMLIDAGKEANADEILRVLQELNIKSIDHIVATHYDQDHVEGFAKVIKGSDGVLGTADDHQPREKIWDRGGSVKSQSYREIREEMRKKQPDLYQQLSGDNAESFPAIDLGAGVTVKVLTVNGKVWGKDNKIYTVDCQGEENCYSVGTLITFGKFRFWTAGDLTGGGLDTPDVESTLAQHLDPVDVYRAHHHGSRTSSNQNLIKAIKPQVVAISAGEQNSFCHPNTGVLRDLHQYVNPTFLLTTKALTQTTGSCSDSGTTQSFLASLGAKAYLGLGSFAIVAQPHQFSLQGKKVSAPISWQTR